jgi:outer membrane protein OmpA-like peptidoglycan-associated protein
MAGNPEDRRRRLLAVILLAVFLIMGGVLGLSRCSGPGHHRAVAVAPRPSLPAALIGGGGVTPRPVSGNLSAPGSVGEVLFAEAGIAIDANARRVIDVAGQNIRDRHAAVVTVTGYTDAIGSAPANRALSLRRVRAVIKILRQDLTGAPGPIQYRPVARGQGRPVAPNSTAAGRQLNRRVVITIG